MRVSHNHNPTPARRRSGSREWPRLPTASLDGILRLAGGQWRHDGTIDSLAALLKLIEDRDAPMRRRADVAVVTGALAAAVLARLDGILDGETETAERMTWGSDPRRAP